MVQTTLARLSVAALLLGLLSACNPYVWGGGALAVGPQLATGRNAFYHLDKAIGKRCSDSTYFDRPLHCVNETD